MVSSCKNLCIRQQICFVFFQALHLNLSGLLPTCFSNLGDELEKSVQLTTGRGATLENSEYLASKASARVPSYFGFRMRVA